MSPCFCPDEASERTQFGMRATAANRVFVPHRPDGVPPHAHLDPANCGCARRKQLNTYEFCHLWRAASNTASRRCQRTAGRAKRRLAPSASVAASSSSVKKARTSRSSHATKSGRSTSSARCNSRPKPRRPAWSTESMSRIRRPGGSSEEGRIPPPRLRRALGRRSGPQGSREGLPRGKTSLESVSGLTRSRLH